MHDRNYKEKFCKKRSCRQPFKPKAGNQVYCELHKQGNHKTSPKKESTSIKKDEIDTIVSDFAMESLKEKLAKFRESVRDETAREIMNLIANHFNYH
jgi:hypothetical protein